MDENICLSNILEKVDTENKTDDCAENTLTDDVTLRPELDGELKLSDAFVRMKHIDRALAYRAYRSDNGR